MNSLEQVIEEARTKGDYRCAHCDYALGAVPLTDDLSIICPECGYEMVFEVKVKLKPHDPEYDREVRGRLGRIERMLLVLVIGLVVITIGVGIIAFAIVGI